LLSEILSMVDGSPDLRAIEVGQVSVPVRALTDSENLSHSIKRDAGAVQDKRLRIVIAMLRQTVHELSLRGKHLVTVEWVPTHLMVADALTKIMDRAMLRAFLKATAFSVVCARPRKAVASALAVVSQLRTAGASDSASRASDLGDARRRPRVFVPFRSTGADVRARVGSDGTGTSRTGPRVSGTGCHGLSSGRHGLSFSGASGAHFARTSGATFSADPVPKGQTAELPKVREDHGPQARECGWYLLGLSAVAEM